MSDTAVLRRHFGDVSALRERYALAEPFPHIVLDDFLDESTLGRAIDEFPDLDEAQWTNYLHVNERKYANSDLDTWAPILRDIATQLMSDPFVRLVEEITGISDLIADPALDGGGLHTSIAGGYLNVHTDFTSHHVHPTWERRVNLLLYLNRDWDPSYGGDLELWDAQMTRCVTKVAPIANRVVLFTTTPDAFHGHPVPLAAPQGVSRKSLALYYFTESEHAVARPTQYRARPDDGWRRILIAADQQALRAYDVAKRRLGLSDDTASRLLGRLDRSKRRPQG